MAAVIGIGFAIIVGFALRAQRRPVTSGVAGLPGMSGVARTDIDPIGQVQSGAELWSAELASGQDPIQRGDQVEVVGVDGLRLQVRKKTKS